MIANEFLKQQLKSCHTYACSPNPIGYLCTSAELRKGEEIWPLMVMIQQRNQLIQDRLHPDPTVILRNVLSSENGIPTLQLGPEQFLNRVSQGHGEARIKLEKC